MSVGNLVKVIRDLIVLYTHAHKRLVVHRVGCGLSIVKKDGEQDGGLKEGVAGHLLLRHVNIPRRKERDAWTLHCNLSCFEAGVWFAMKLACECQISASLNCLCRSEVLSNLIPLSAQHFFFVLGL